MKTKLFAILLVALVLGINVLAQDTSQIQIDDLYYVTYERVFTVTAGELNIRSGPSVSGYKIIDKAHAGDKLKLHGSGYENSMSPDFVRWIRLDKPEYTDAWIATEIGGTPVGTLQYEVTSQEPVPDSDVNALLNELSDLGLLEQTARLTMFKIYIVAVDAESRILATHSQFFKTWRPIECNLPQSSQPPAILNDNYVVANINKSDGTATIDDQVFSYNKLLGIHKEDLQLGLVNMDYSGVFNSDFDDNIVAIVVNWGCEFLTVDEFQVEFFTINLATQINGKIAKIKTFSYPWSEYALFYRTDRTYAGQSRRIAVKELQMPPTGTKVMIAPFLITEDVLMFPGPLAQNEILVRNKQEMYQYISYPDPSKTYIFYLAIITLPRKTD